MIFPYQPFSSYSSKRRNLGEFLSRSRFSLSTLLIAIITLAALWLHSYRRFDGITIYRQYAWSAGFRRGCIWFERDRLERAAVTPSGEYASVEEAYAKNWTCSWRDVPRGSIAFAQGGSFRHNVAVVPQPSSLWPRSMNADFIKVPLWSVVTIVSGAYAAVAWSGRK